MCKTCGKMEHKVREPKEIAKSMGKNMRKEAIKKVMNKAKDKKGMENDYKHDNYFL